MAETDEEKVARETAEAETKAAEEAAKKPPWGSDEDFDPEKAWKLITDLRGDKTGLQTERDELKTTVKEFEDANKSEKDKLSEGKTSAEQQATEAVQEATRLRVAMRHGLEEDDLDLLGSGDEEAIDARAKRLAERFTAPKEEESAEGPARRPRERLRPGAAPASEPDKSDPAALAEDVPRGW